LAVAKDAEEADKKAHRDFVAQTKSLIKNLADFITQNFKMGLNWNPKGGDISSYGSGAGAGAPAAPPVEAGGAAPPPPPPVDPNFQLTTTAAAAPATDEKKPGGMAAVFASISKGEGITSGLKKVTADMKSKNRKDDPVLEVKSHGAGGGSASHPAEPKKEVKKEPKLELRQGTWFCENYENTTVEISEGQMKQNVYIFKCTNTVVNIKDKVKSIQVDNCNKGTITFHSVVSTFELVNCKRLTVQVMDSCPSLNVDKSSGIHVILTPDSFKTPPNIITSSISEVNLSIPGANADADPIELPLPEQYVTTYENGKLITLPIKHSGA